MTLSKESAAGCFVLVGLICIAWLTIQLGRMEFFDSSGYTLNAAFTSVSGLRTGAEVQIAGVAVGRVKSIRFDNKTAKALVELQMQDGIELTDDVIASIKTSGIIGDKYVSLEPGGSDRHLENGGEITDTESAVDLESLISKYVFGKV